MDATPESPVRKHTEKWPNTSPPVADKAPLIGPGFAEAVCLFELHPERIMRRDGTASGVGRPDQGGRPRAPGRRVRHGLPFRSPYVLQAREWGLHRRTDFGLRLHRI